MATATARDAELAELIEEQRQDDARHRVWPGKGQIQESAVPGSLDDPDDRPGLDRFVDPSLIEPPDIVRLAEALDLLGQLEEAGELPEAAASVAPEMRSNLATVAVALIGQGAIWTAEHVAYDPMRGPCPACHDEHPGRPAFCLVCSRTDRDRTPHPARGTPPRSMTRARARRDRGGKPLKGGVG
jgi:hypothetical protein